MECKRPAGLPAHYPVYCQSFLLGGQSGTYIETNAHVDLDAAGVNDLDIGRFVMPAVAVRIPGKGANSPIELSDVERAACAIQPGDAVILSTGWDVHWFAPSYYVEGSPYITADAAHWLFARDIACLAADFPRFDYLPEPCFPWDAFWKQVSLLLAPVCGVFEERFERGRLFAFPLKIRGAMGTPVRAVVEVDGS